MCEEKTKSLVTMEGGLYRFELPAYGNQAKERIETWLVNYTCIKESLCVVRSSYSLCEVAFVR